MNTNCNLFNKRTFSFICLLIIFTLLFIVGCQIVQSKGEEIYNQAIKLENKKSFGEALELYEQALSLLADSKENNLAKKCSEAIQRIKLFKEMYIYTAEQIEGLIKESYPQLAAERISDLFANNELESYYWDGEDHYFSESVVNLIYRNMDLMFANTVLQQTYSDLLQKINQNAKTQPEYFWRQYQKGVTYRGTHELSIPRDVLPQAGTYRIWFPIPINSGPQANVTIESVTPEKWVKAPPTLDQEIGLIYMEIPMEELKEDLNINITFTFTHYEQRFNVVLENVGEYDKNSEFYKKYTKSYGNIRITPEIQKAAKKIAGDETNPYIVARKLYDFIVNEIDYAFMPHYMFWPRTDMTESVYVFQNKRGDCGAQSIYFAAMCRSLGIPARCTGGYQLFSGNFGGHFWAEFYLPNYGWIPVDTSAAQLALYLKDATVDQQRTFIDYFFGNQDSMRCIIQKDTDTPLIPQANGLVLLPAAIQLPTIEYSVPNGVIPEFVLLDYWSMQCEKISE